MAKDVRIITDDISVIQEMWQRRIQIKQMISQLQAEDESIVSTLTAKIGLDLQSDKAQHFNIGGLRLKATPKLYRKVDTERAKNLLAEDPDARLLSDIFKEKYELSTSRWKALTPDQQAIFVDCITVSSGKPAFEEDK